MTEPPQKARRKPKPALDPLPPELPIPAEVEVYTCPRCGGWMRYDDTPGCLFPYVCGACPHKQNEKPDIVATEPDDLEW